MAIKPSLQWRVNTDNYLTIGIAKRQSANQFVKEVEQWCRYCGNPPSSIRQVRKLKKHLAKGYIKVIVQAIRENNLQDFSTKDVIKALNAENISDGTCQRDGLAILCALGYFTRINFVKIDEKKNTSSLTYLFKKQIPVKYPECYDVLKDEHNNDYSEDQWVQTEIFTINPENKVTDGNTID